jgi:hypothetical protein
MPDNRRGIADVSTGISWSARLGRRKRSRALTVMRSPATRSPSSVPR